jgi:hypothetical protein
MPLAEPIVAALKITLLMAALFCYDAAMPIILKNKEIQLTLEIAGELYKHCRFDWNGLVAQVHYRGVPLLSEEKPQGERNPARFGRGLHNEFGIQKVIGYNDIPVGEWFPKIGTGWLKKDDKPYFFYTDYAMQPFTFYVESDSRSALFTCLSGERNGFGFRYTKQIELDNNRFLIKYTLVNEGSRPLHTDEYCHNFIGFNNRRLGPAYRLSFPYPLQPAAVFDGNNPAGLVNFEGNSLCLTRETNEQYSFADLAGGRETPALWTITHDQEKLSLSEKGDFTTRMTSLWGWGHVISPELFYDFHLHPGEAARWQREYTVTAL